MKARREANDTAALPLEDLSLRAVTVRGGRRRGVDRGAIVAVAAICFVSMALAKPWEDDATAGAVPDATVSVDSRAPRELVDRAALRSAGRAIDRTIAGAILEPRTGWGVRAIVERRAGLRESWLPIPAPPDGAVWSGSDGFGSARGVIELPTTGLTVAAIGLTSPPDDPILDLRIRSRHGGGARVAAHPLAGSPHGTDPLLLPPVELGDDPRWSPGTYFIDVLTSAAVHRLAIILPGDPPTAMEATELDPYPEEALLRSFAGLPPGLFIVRGGSGKRPGLVDRELLDAIPGEPLDEAAMWLGLPRTDGRFPIARTSAGRGRDDVVAIGLGLEAGGRLGSARLVALDTGTIAPQPALIDGDRGGRGQTFLFRPHGRAFPAGAYRLDVRWRRVDRFHDARSWHLELVPGGDNASIGPMLKRLRTLAPHAGRWSVMVGDGRPLEATTFDAPPDVTLLGPSCRGGRMVAAARAVLGVGFPGDTATIGVARVFEGGRTLPASVSVASGAVDGLALFAPRWAASWPAGYYAVTVRQRGGARVVAFCVGVRTSDGLRVPDGAGSVDAFRSEQAAPVEAP